MGLLNSDNGDASGSAQFEAMDDDVVASSASAADAAASSPMAAAITANQTAPAQPAVSAPAVDATTADPAPIFVNVPDAASTQAVATTAPKGLLVRQENSTVVAMRESRETLNGFKDALPVDYDTLDQIIVSNGNFVDRESKKVLGDTVVFNFISFQEAYVVSPEVDKAPKDTLRFSKDGVTCTDGTPVHVHITWLKANGFPNARLKERVVVVGAIESASKTSEFNGQLVQFDLSPKSRSQWTRFMANCAYQLSAKLVTAEQINKVKAETLLKTSADNDSYAVAKFTLANK